LDDIGDTIDAERAVLVTSPGFRRRGTVARIERIMEGRLARILDSVTPNPSIDDIQALRTLEGLRDVDAVIALGGGSSIDTAKALSRVISQSREGIMPDEFWKESSVNVGAAVPIYAVPTTAGTGSEVTPTATIWDYKAGVKHSLCGDDLYPRMAILDPALTYDMPESITMSSGLDAISHALESIWNRNASPITIALATQSLRLALSALPRLKKTGHDRQARHSMMQASLMAGLAISQTRTAMSHSMSYPLTLEFGIPHGIACSFALPEILEFNAGADDGRLNTLATELGFGTIARLKSELCELLESSLTSATTLNKVLEGAPIPDILNRMIAKGRIENNIRSVGQDDLDQILRRALNRYAKGQNSKKALT